MNADIQAARALWELTAGAVDQTRPRVAESAEQVASHQAAREAWFDAGRALARALRTAYPKPNAGCSE